MIDVHPAPHAAHTWKDFLIHIATIVVGLLIALSLEQTIEFLPSPRRDPRSSGTPSLKSASTIAHLPPRHRSLSSGRSHAAQQPPHLHLYLRDHPGTPEANLPGVLFWPRHTFEPTMSAWNDSGQASVLAMMPRDEVDKYSSTYFNLQRALDG